MKTRSIVTAAIPVSLALGAFVMADASCSLAIDTKANQCETNADCVARGAGFESRVCIDNFCVKPGGCDTTAQCRSAHNGEPWICQKDSRTCVLLTSPECVILAEETDVANENTLWFGLLSLQTTTPHQRAGADLARYQISQIGQGLPPASKGGKPRPMGLVACDTEFKQGEETVGLKNSLEHLVNYLKVPAIVGPAQSGETITTLTQYTVAAGILDISATAGAPTITDIPKNGLFFRTSGSDTIAVKALTQILREIVEPQLRSGPNAIPEGTPIKVAVLHKGDALGIANANNTAILATFNGKSATENGASYKDVNYGDPTDPENTNPEARYAAAVNDIIAFEPHVIFGYGSGEFKSVVTPVEEKWHAALNYRPFWLVVKGIAAVLTDEMPKFISGDPETGAPAHPESDWPSRVFGSQPYVDKSTDAYASFSAAFGARFKDLEGKQSVTATPSFFDSTYVLAYAVAANGSNPVTGANLAAAYRTRMMSGDKKKNVGDADIFSIYSELEAGGTIDLVGLVGSLDFDEAGDMPQTQEIFCMKTEAPMGGSGGAGGGGEEPIGKVIGTKAAGLIFDPAADTLTGELKTCPGP